MSIQLKNWLGDITELKVEAIVNAANRTLLGGGGVDGAIHRVAGPELVAEAKLLGGAETGEAKITKGYNLPADYVIHAVGPIYKNGEQGEPELLAAAYRNALLVAEEYSLKSIAFPAISTGIYAYPLEDATTIALNTIKEQMPRLESIGKIVFVSFDEETFDLYERKIAELLKDD